jgi:phage tail protein X
MATYTTVSGDTWDMIARQAYGDELLAHHIMQDRENITLLDYQVFPTGIEVYIPDLSETQTYDDDLPDWRKD